MKIYVYICMYIYTHIYIHIYVCIHVMLILSHFAACAYIYIYICTYIYAHICMHIYNAYPAAFCSVCLFAKTSDAACMYESSREHTCGM